MLKKFVPKRNYNDSIHIAQISMFLKNGNFEKATVALKKSTLEIDSFRDSINIGANKLYSKNKFHVLLKFIYLFNVDLPYSKITLLRDLLKHNDLSGFLGNAYRLHIYQELELEINGAIQKLVESQQITQVEAKQWQRKFIEMPNK